MKKILTCLLATLGLTTACGQQNFENVDVQGFSELIENPGVILLDVRTASEYAEGHIAGAMLIDQGQSDFMEKAKAVLPADKTIAVYCKMHRNEIKNDIDVIFVEHINHFLQIFCCSVSACWSKKSSILIAPALVTWVFTDWHELNTVVAIFFHMVNQEWC